MDLAMIKHKFGLGSMNIDEIKLLIDTVEKQQVELVEGKRREESYIDGIEEVEAMLSMANNEIEGYKLQETLLLERLKKNAKLIQNYKCKTTYKVYEENLRLAQENTELKQELALIKGEMSG